MSRLTGTDAYGLMEAYSAVYTPQELTEEKVWEEVENWVNSLLEEGYDLSEYTWEEMYEAYENLNEVRRDPRGRPASGEMSVYGGRGTPSPDPEGDDNISRMDRAQRRVKRTQPSAKGMAADALFTKYSARQSGSGAGGEEGPGPKAPKRSGRSGRGANTDRGSGNAAKRRMSEDFDLFDTILEHLVAEGYADTEEAALKIMANMSEEWRESILSEEPVQNYRDMKRADENRGGARGPELSHNTTPGLKGKPQPGRGSVTQKPTVRGREFTNPPS
jgi:hypothetical protein